MASHKWNHIFTIIISIFFLLPVFALVDEGAVNPGLDSTLNHIEYQPFIEPDNPRFVAERQRVLKWIAKPEGPSDFAADLPRNVILYAMYSFMRHGFRYQAEIDQWRHR